MSVDADRAGNAERAWWLRAVLVLQAPGAVFAALRDGSDEAAEARQEPIVAVLFLAAVSVVLGTTIAGRLLDDPEYDPLLIAVWAIVGGAIYAFGAYFVLGLLLLVGLRLGRSHATYRHARHILAFASVPIALSLLAWPVRLAVHGEDLFRSGGADAGGGHTVFEALETAFVVWAVGLLVLGVRVVHEWSWPRALAASVLPAAAPTLALARAYGLV
ncbi:MAG: YIP1 family protein [Thermoleophilia bacterium]|nr:YIP1 family protein [Thermoleophilia bacterium]